MISVLQKLSNFNVTNGHQSIKNTVLNLKIKILESNNLTDMRHMHNGYADFLASSENKWSIWGDRGLKLTQYDIQTEKLDQWHF